MRLRCLHSKEPNEANMASDTARDLNALVTTPITTPLAAEDLSAILSSPPFVSIPGTFNVRDLSGHCSFPSAVAPKLGYRAGSLERLTLEGQNVIKGLGIRTIFDLRSLKERDEFPTAEIEGVETIRTPSTLDNETTAEAQARKQREGVFSLLNMYMDMLETHSAAFTVVLKHLAAHPGEPFLFHCTAGKDRTGLLAFLLQEAAGSSMESANMDWALTRVGVEPVREFLTTKLMGGKELPREQVEQIMNSEKMKAYSEVP